MKYVSLIWIILLLGCGKQPQGVQPGESRTKNLDTISVYQALKVFKSIDPALTFVLKTNEYMGDTDKLYYSDRRSPASQVTINIGTTDDEDQSITTLFLSVSAYEPLTAEIKSEILALFNQYLKGFIELTSLSNDQAISAQLSGISRNVSVVDIQVDCGRYFFYLTGSEGDGNPEYFTYLLEITEESFQKELNARFSKDNNF